MIEILEAMLVMTTRDFLFLSTNVLIGDEGFMPIKKVIGAVIGRLRDGEMLRAHLKPVLCQAIVRDVVEDKIKEH